MQKSLKKKLSAAILVGCSAMFISSAAMAAPPENRPAPPPPPIAVCYGAADCGSDYVFSRQGRQQVQDYSEQFQSKYSWMYAGTRHSAAISFVNIDQAVDNNKISAEQGDKLKKELLKFYKNLQKNDDAMRKLDRYDAREYRREHRDEFSIERNIDAIAAKVNVSANIVRDIFYITPPHARGGMPGDFASRRHHRGMRYADHLHQLTANLIQDGKLTQEEADALGKYVDKIHREMMDMTPEKRSQLLDTYRQMSDSDRLEKIAQDTGISTERLQAIFTQFKDSLPLK